MDNKKAQRPVFYRQALLTGILVCSMSHFCYAQPSISSFSPASGPVGSSVIIAGSNFSTTFSNNIVYFGAVKATVKSASSSSLTVTVPYGTTYQPVSVTVNGLTAYAGKPFIVTFANGGNLSSNSFAQSIDSTTDLHPNDVVMIDFDGDGKPDLATANNYSTTSSPASVSVLRNTSTGGNISFASHQDIFTGVLTFAIAARDLDGDGKPDMISSSIVDKTISVFRNTSTPGAISFAAKTDYATGENPYGIAIGDLDGDGRPDLAVTNYLSNTISIFRNTSSPGNISFAAKTDIATGADFGPWGIAIQDLDGDGKPDLAVANNLSNTISVFRNTSTTGNITFSTSIHFYAGVSSMGLAIGVWMEMVSLNGCVSPLSDPYHYTVADSSDPVHINPNPVTDWLRIGFNFPNINTVTIVLYKLRREKLLEKNNVYSGSTLSMAAYAPGNYILRLINESNNEVLSSQQIIKL